MMVTVNGEPREVADQTSVGELLAGLGLSSGRVAVEVNEEVVPRDTYEARMLADDDRVEVVHFVGGG